MVQGKIKVQYRQQKVAILKNADEPIYLYVPSIDRYSTIEEEAIIAYAAKAANIAQNDMRATFEALADAFEFFLTNGHSFKVDGVGTFSLSVRAKQAKATEADAVMGADAVEKVGINFLPAREIKQLIESASIETEVNGTLVAPEPDEPIIRKLTYNGRDLIKDGKDNEQAGAISEGGKALLYGYNLGKSGLIPFSGLEGATILNGQFVYKATGKPNEVEGVFSAPLTLIKSFGGIELTPMGNPEVTAITFDGLPIAGESGYPLGKTTIAILGKALSGTDVTFNGERVTRKVNTDSKIEFDAVISEGANEIIAAGDSTIIYGVEDMTSVVSSLSANGVTILCFDSSPVVLGRKYRFVALGRNISNEVIAVSEGATVKAISRSSERVVFDAAIASDFSGSTITLYVGEQFEVTLTISIDTPVVLNVNDAIPEGGEIEVRNNSELPYYVNFATAIPEAQHDKVEVNVGGVLVPVSQWKTDNKSCMFVYSAGLNTRNAVRVTFNDATIFNFTIKGDRNVD